MLFLQNALSTVDAVAAREIVDPEQVQRMAFLRIIDGTVMCLNASSWCKQLAGVRTPSLPPNNPYPISSVQFSSVFFTKAMNSSATAPSMRRWS
jgi:hypothetical protein